MVEKVDTPKEGLHEEPQENLELEENYDALAFHHSTLRIIICYSAKDAVKTENLTRKVRIRCR